MTRPRLVVANLLAEEELAGRVDLEGTGAPARVASVAAAMGSLLDVLAEPGDALWLSAKLDPSRRAPVASQPGPVAPQPGQVAPALTGSLAAALEGRDVLPWCWTPALSAAAVSAGATWAWPGLEGVDVAPLGEVTARCHDRRFAHALADTLACALPGASVVESGRGWDESRRRAARASTTGRWVAKSCRSAAGRGLRWGPPAEAPPDPERERADLAWCQAQAAVIVEPWLDRAWDGAGLGVVLADGQVRVAGTHAQLVDARGHFQGVVLEPAAPQGPGDRGSGRVMRDDVRGDDVRSVMPPSAGGRLAETVAAVGQALGDAGFRGPFGVDACLHRDAGGVLHLHPLVEINARLTMGWVAHRLARRVPGADAAARVVLRVGRDLPPASADVTIHPVLHAGPPDGREARLELFDDAAAARSFGRSAPA